MSGNPFTSFNFVPAVIPQQQIIPDASAPLPKGVLPAEIQDVFLISRPNPSVSTFTAPPPPEADYVSQPLVSAPDIVPVIIPNQAQVQTIFQPPPPPASYTSQPQIESGILFVYPEYQAQNVAAFPEAQEGLNGIAPLVTYAAEKPLYASAYDTGIQASNWSLYPAISTINADGNNIENVSSMTISSITLNSIYLDNQELSATSTNVTVNGIPLVDEQVLQSTMSNWSRYTAVTNVDFGQFEILSTTSIQLDGVFLSATPTELLINGVPVVTSTALQSLSSITDWALFQAISTVNFDNNGGSNVGNLTGVKNVTFGTFLPTQGASITALNDLNFSFITAATNTLAAINNLNNIAWWNPDYPGVPGLYINQYTKRLLYKTLTTAYLASDTKLCVPALFTSAAAGLAGGKIEALGENARVVTVNGEPCASAWSLYPAEDAVQMEFNQIINTAEIQFAKQVGGPFNLLTIADDGLLRSEGKRFMYNPAITSLNMSSFSISTVKDISFVPPGGLLGTNGGGQLTYNGVVIQTGAGNIADWAQYAANGTVTIPHQHNLDINPENSFQSFLTYPTVTMNANLNLGEATDIPFNSPNVAIFPADFNVGDSLFPATTLNLQSLDITIGNIATTLNNAITSLTNTTIESDSQVNMEAGLAIFITAGAEMNVTSVESMMLESSLNMDLTCVGEAGIITITGQDEVNIAAIIGPVTVESPTDISHTAPLITTNGAAFNVLSGSFTSQNATLDLASAGNAFIGGGLEARLQGVNQVLVASSASNVAVTAATRIDLTAPEVFINGAGGMTVEADVFAMKGFYGPTLGISSIYQYPASDPFGIKVLSNMNVAGSLKADTFSASTITTSTITGIGSGNVSGVLSRAVYFNPAASPPTLFYGAPRAGILLMTSATLTVTPAQSQQTYLFTGNATVDIDSTALVGQPAFSFSITVKNGRTPAPGNIQVQENSVNMIGPTNGIIFGSTASQNGGIVYIVWSGSQLVMY